MGWILFLVDMRMVDLTICEGRGRFLSFSDITPLGKNIVMFFGLMRTPTPVHYVGHRHGVGQNTLPYYGSGQQAHASHSHGIRLVMFAKKAKKLSY
jgi:hypothetical protein